jgi:hypothetical protein
MKYRLPIIYVFAVGAAATTPTLAWSQQKAMSKNGGVT